MEFSDRLGNNAGRKLIPFRSPAPVVRGLDAAPEADLLAHDVTVLRRPVAVHNFEAPRLQTIDALAHDARNLMTSLSLIAGLLEEPGVLRNEHQHYAGDLKSLTGSLGALVDQMAAATPKSITAGTGSQPVFAREPLRPRLPSVRRSAVGPASETQADAGAMVKSCERLLAAIAGPNVAMHVSYERGLGTLALAGEDLTRILINLVKNASEAMPGGGRVSITVRRALGARPAALITVEDTGGGIPAHALGQIFQAGFSSKKASRGWPSTEHHGLGLTIVRELVEAAGGSVRITSALKKGTKFELKVPCSKV